MSTHRVHVGYMPNPVYVADYGTTTAQVQSAADAAVGRHLVFPSSTTYTLTSAINLPAGCMVIGNNSTLKTPDNSTSSTSHSDSLLEVEGDDVSIDNLNFDGNNANQGATWSQHRHCLRVHGAYSNARITNCDFTNIIGDGVYINLNSTGSNVMVQGCTFSSNYINRNGVSVITGSDIIVDSNTFTNCSRSGMPGPIDVEPNLSSETLNNVTISNNTISGGSTAGTGTLPGIVYSGFQNAAADTVVFQNNTITGTRFTCGILFIGINGGPFNAATGLLATGNNINSIGSSGKIGVELDYWIGADVTNNTFNGMQFGIYNYFACPGTQTGNSYTGVTTQIQTDSSQCS